MIELNFLITSDNPSGTAMDGSLRLDFDQRVKCRLRALLEDGREVAIFLPRGTVLKDKDILRSACGLQVQVVAADESLSVCAVEDPLMFARACYHLGNRHVPLQIHAGELSYQHDHVLDDMLRGFGLDVHNCSASFHPENGAYSKHGSNHSHSHAH